MYQNRMQLDIDEASHWAEDLTKELGPPHSLNRTAVRNVHQKRIGSSREFCHKAHQRYVQRRKLSLKRVIDRRRRTRKAAIKRRH